MSIQQGEPLLTITDFPPLQGTQFGKPRSYIHSSPPPLLLFLGYIIFTRYLNRWYNQILKNGHFWALFSVWRCVIFTALRRAILKDFLSSLSYLSYGVSLVGSPIWKTDQYMPSFAASVITRTVTLQEKILSREDLQ